jgi:acetyl-CoA synthetase
MPTTAGKWIWTPDPDAIRRTNVWHFVQSMGFDNREEFLRDSRENPERFWDSLVHEVAIDWFKPYSTVLDLSRGPEWARWFLGGKLNIAWNCLDRHVQTNTTAIVWEAENGSRGDVSFAELHRRVNRFANALSGLGLQPGDRVAMCMPMSPEIVVVLYACLKLGLVLVPIFGGFGTRAIAARLQDSGAKLIVTADYLERRGKRIPLKEKVDQASSLAPTIERVVVLRYRGGEIPWSPGRDLWWHEFIEKRPEQCDCRHLDSETTAFLLYTSGTTGKPKGAVHTHAGALVQMAKEIYLAFDHKPDDRFFWLTDIGWMMGPWSIIGNHHFGGTILLYDGAPDYPAPNRLWEIIDRHRITTLGISPTAIRLLMRSSHPQTCSLESLRLLGSTGEPWDDKSYLWFFEQIGRKRCPIINISGGTEIVGCFLLPLPMQPLKPCTLGDAAPGMAVEVVDEDGRPVRGKQGYLICAKPSPSMTKGIWGEDHRYLETYWSRWKGWWYHGDWASVDEDGCWFLHGRADESMNVAGRKVGPGEVEEALMEHPAVSEAAVIGVPDELTGEAIAAFFVPKSGCNGTQHLLEELSDHIARTMGPAFRPVCIRAIPELPKTQSGKIVRRLIRCKFLGEPLGDISSVENPAALQAIEVKKD